MHAAEYVDLTCAFSRLTASSVIAVCEKMWILSGWCCLTKVVMSRGHPSKYLAMRFMIAHPLFLMDREFPPLLP